MARDKERTINPAQQQRKLEKQKQLKKSRAELQARRNEKLAKRNPDRIERQIQDLNALEASGEIKPREKAILEDLERDLRAVRKAREALGEKAPIFGGRRREGEGDSNNHVLGKRRHNGERKQTSYRQQESSGSDTDDSVRRIPMPEDTPPPIPREFRRGNNFNRASDPDDQPQSQGNSKSYNKPPIPVVESKTMYSSAPQIRDLKKEAVGRFVPDVVRRKQQAAKGGLAGRLLEPEEMDRLEAEGYLSQKQKQVEKEPATEASADAPTSSTTNLEDSHARRLEEEERRLLQELEMQDDQIGGVDGKSTGTEALPQRPTNRHVEIEEVKDEDA
ncbi:uncharacterized protein A1O9_02785 [Exophiala aquamarina CBS 119918]|uniref:Wbp11/ELF5/Saf1 N-terminal domain-containing protein n=1 Tax=Exophiala aquamarina CBS 119918 TaxID=1182545 RepID=A0A072Q000_9EURO|nr:uncharacterized protein A1O9_02785 [Exophiala aquamarina CBS 119918]KEF61220.1 hypothetical protein A1O9_02785 [Exophiala aquamarina CBS 119918]